MPFPMEKPSEMAAITSISMPMISAVLMGFPPFGAGPAPLAVSAYHNWMKNARAAKLLDKRRPPDYNETRGAVLLGLTGRRPIISKVFEIAASCRVRGRLFL